MFKFVRSCSLFASLVCLLAAAGAYAQAAPETPLGRQLDRIDLGLSGIYELTRDSSGGTVSSQSVSSASGLLATLRYTKSPWIGAEMNYKYSRMTENYTYTPPLNTVHTLGVQANVTELTWGYVAHAPGTYFGLKPYGGVGLGTTEFKPTPNGGEGLLRQFRATYYWNIGADYIINDSHFGARVQVRQLFYLSPDFGQSYLTSGARTSTFEPSFGFFARF